VRRPRRPAFGGFAEFLGHEQAVAEQAWRQRLPAASSHSAATTSVAANAMKPMPMRQRRVPAARSGRGARHGERPRTP
jgi:hypothetical protein